jgi:two-component system, NtrC family, response regulator
MSTILIVDDEQDVLTAFRAVLQRAGYRVGTAPGPRKALQLLDSERPDLVLLDINLGSLDQTDGLDLLRQMRERMPRLKVVIVSAYLDLVTHQAALDAGALDCWPKPVTMQMLTERTAQALASPGKD